MPRNTGFDVLKLLACCTIVWLTGCTTGSVLTRPGEPGFAPAQPVLQQPAMQHNGSIYMSSVPRPLFEDIKARQVGDLLTVILDEQTDASKSASTGITKDSTTDISAPTILGQDVTLGGNPLGTGLDSASDFSGEADSSQSNKLQGSITVTVAEVLPNGNLRIQGEKWIAINQGDEYVRLRGIVRPVDIAPTNTVFSTQVADAQITYRGKGATADSNAMGWLARFFISPLWPF
ncbi:MAG: flagellar basal body L-ring protein FlgH [Gammaproteobacteria bacterium]